MIQKSKYLISLYYKFIKKMSTVDKVVKSFNTSKIEDSVFVFE